MCGNGGKWVKNWILEPFIVKFRGRLKFGALFNKPPNSSVGSMLDIFHLILASPRGEGSFNPAETMKKFSRNC